jgi:quinohemoprotein ethanol dehydrogenase
MKHLVLIGLFCLVFVVGCDPRASLQTQKGSPEHLKSALVAIDDQALSSSDPAGNWITYGQTYREQRYSPLADIDRTNVQKVGLAWHLELGGRRGIQATPLVIDGILFFTSTWSVVHAVDAKTGQMLWSHDPQVDRTKAADLCCGAINRGLAAYKGALFVGTLDGRLLSLDGATGEVNWEQMTVPRDSNYSITGAPRIVNGNVVIGNAGGEYRGVRGYVTAYDAATGSQQWRFYTVPGDPALGFESPALAVAAETWTGSWWEQGGGGTVWDAIVFDPELNLIYIGVGNGTHWNHQIRSPDGGDNLFLSSIVALDADTGAYRWHFQTTPGDSWDYTATQHIVLADLTIDGIDRKVLMQAPKNGFFYVLDRETGEFLSGDKYTYVSWADGLDEQGRPLEREGARYTDGKAHWVTPSSYGAHSWQPMSYSGRTGLMYIPATRMSAPFARTQIDGPDAINAFGSGHDVMASFAFDRSLEMVFDTHPDAPQPGTATGELIAYDPVTQRRVWARPQASQYNGGVLSTAGGLVLQGDAKGYLRFFDDESGEELHKLDVRSGVIAPPVTYLVDGEQYITLLVGWGGGAGQTMKHVTRLYPGAVYTFKLGGETPLPQREEADEKPLTTLAFSGSDVEVGHGYNLYMRNCIACHGAVGSGGGAIPDLARSHTTTYDNLESIVIGGLLAPMGMPKHAHLNEVDIHHLRHYLLFVAESLRTDVPIPVMETRITQMQQLALKEHRTRYDGD